jgi:hypothetical protein
MYYKCARSVPINVPIDSPTAKVTTNKKVTKETVVKKPDNTTTTTREIIEDVVSVTPVKKKNRAGVGVRYNYDPKTFADNPIYDFRLERRLFDSSIFGGVTISTDKSVGLSLTVEF